MPYGAKKFDRVVNLRALEKFVPRQSLKNVHYCYFEININIAAE